MSDEVVEDTIEAIRASDLLLLMDVVKEATGLWNAIERDGVALQSSEEWTALGNALRILGLIEVT